MKSYINFMRNRFSISMMVLTLVAGLALVSVPSLAANGENADTDDIGILIAIDEMLTKNEAVRASLIDVGVKDGVVTLGGSVRSLLAQKQALKTAYSIRGVRSVINYMNVDVPNRKDADILKDVKDAFFVNPGTETFQIGVSVEDGVVTLSGRVDGLFESTLAKDVASGVLGVRDVTNDLLIVRKDDRADDDIRGDIVARFENDVWIEPNNIEVKVKDGEVTLDGRVNTLAKKERANTLASIVGVKSVHDENLIVQLFSDVKQRDHVIKTDAEIIRAVEDALKMDRRVDSKNVIVTFKDQSAVLTGKVGSLYARIAAEQDAMNTVGVHQVRNHLKVRPQSVFDDSLVESYVRDALKRSPYIERADIKVAADKGVVSLLGRVDTPFERKRAEWVASRIIGVIEVINLLEVNEYFRATKPAMNETAGL